jgi:hypothetical protein
MEYNWQEIQNECVEIAIVTEANEVSDMMNEGPKYSIHETITNLNVGYMYDICGNAYIKFKDQRNSFAKAYKKFIQSIDEIYSTDVFNLYMHSSRQELRVNKAVAFAVANHINSKYKANVYVKWYEN